MMTRARTLPLIAFVVALTGAAPAGLAQSGNKPWNYDSGTFEEAMKDTEKFLRAGHKIPESALGRYEMLFSAAMAMKIKMGFTAYLDPTTGERHLKLEISIGQTTGPKSSLQVKEMIRFRDQILTVIDGKASTTLTSPMYTEITDMELGSSQGKITVKIKQTRTAGEATGDKSYDMPLIGQPGWPSRFHKATAFAFAILARRAPRMEKLGVEMYGSKGRLIKAIFRRTGRKKPLEVLGEQQACDIIDVWVQDNPGSARFNSETYYIDPLGRPVQHLMSGKIPVVSKMMKFEPAKAPKEAIVAGAREKLEADELIADAKEDLADKKLQRAWRKIERAMELSPSHPALASLKDKLQQMVTSTYAKLKPSDDEYADTLWDLIRVQKGLDPDHRDLKAMEAAHKAAGGR